MSKFAYGIRGSLPCHPGGNWCQAMAQPLGGGAVTMSRKFEGDDADTRANEAIAHHNEHGRWPSEMGIPADTEDTLAQEGTLGWAVEMLQRGRRVRRLGWNGTGIWLYLVDGSTFRVNRPPLTQHYPHGTEISYRPHIDMRNADGTCGVWSCSQGDVLAEDWELAD